MFKAFKILELFFWIPFLCFSEAKKEEIASSPTITKHEIDTNQKMSTMSKNFSLEAKSCELSKQSKEIQNAWNRYIYILEKFSCHRGDEEFQKLELLVKQNRELLLVVEKNGRTLLMLAILFGREDVVAFLLSLGCDLDIQDFDKNTALLLAIKREFINAVVLLLCYGANPHICNQEKFDAYTLACTLKNQNIIAILLRFSKIPSGFFLARKGSDF